MRDNALNPEPSLLDFLKEKVKTLRNKGGEGRAALTIDSMPPLQLELRDKPSNPEEVSQFKSLISETLTNGDNFKHLRNYIDQCHSFAERGRLDGFEGACYMRSCLKILDEEFLDWSILNAPKNKDLFDEDIAYIDEILEEVSDDAPPVLGKDIPEWVDESHWWWWAPKRQDMSEQERYERIHYEEL